MKTRIARWSGGSRRKRAIEPIPVVDERSSSSGRDRSVDRQDADVGAPGCAYARFSVAGIHEQALQPGIETVRIAEARQLTPRDHQRLLHGILGPSDISQDPTGDRHEPIATRADQDGKRLPIPALRLLDEVAIQSIVPPGVHGDAVRLY